MVRSHSIVVFAVLLQSSIALVQLARSRLYEETDFNVSSVAFPGYGSIIYVSVPVASEDIAKKLILHDFINDEISLYDISKLTKGNAKGYYEIEQDIQQVKILNRNPAYATAPMVGWVVGADAKYDLDVFEARNLHIGPASLDAFTVMSAEPFTIVSKTVGPMRVVVTLTGYDGNGDPTGREVCTNVVEQMDENALSDIQAFVQSPLITLNFDGRDNRNSQTTVSADVGIGNTLDFSGISFVASPGYLGCNDNGQKTYRSSLYSATTSVNYSNLSRFYDVAISAVVNTDATHPVTVRDNTNGVEYKWSTDNITNLNPIKTNNIDVSWTRNEKDLDQSFIVRLVPSN